MEAIGPRVGLCHCPVCELYACPWCWAGADGSCPFCAWSYAALAPVAAVAAATPSVDVATADEAVAATAATAATATSAGRRAATTPRPRDLRAPVAAGTIVLAIALLILNIGASFRPAGGVGGDVTGSETGAQTSPSLAIAVGSVGSVGSASVSPTPTAASPNATGPVAPGQAVGPPPRPGTPAPAATPGPTPAATPKATPAPTPKRTPVPTPRPTASPAPTPEPTPACKTVPNLIGQTVANARSAWKGAGFTGSFTPANGQNKMVVQTQNRTPGSCMPPTSTITVTVSGHL